MREIPSVYNPKNTEDKWYKFWESKKFFHSKPDPKRKPYTIVIPPPNITGILHMGHALNNTVQDILIRYKRMLGFCAEWLPGTDHAGIATQNVVEKELAKEGIKRQDLGREKFLERVWQWRGQYGSTIISQLKRLGCSCDWDRTRFTMDEGLSNAVLEVFIRLYRKGLIYRGNYIINWCPRCQTALSDEEAQHRELKGYLYYIKYPIKGENRYITVATTRPETMLGDVAVAVSPKDKRHKDILNKAVILPLLERPLKVILDDFVDPKFGTGIVKVTPAHDPNDFDMGARHNLEPILVMNPDGTMNKNAGDYEGMDRFEAREAILEDLKERKLLEKIEPHTYSAGHCYRCHTVIEPYLSRQWFVKMKPLAKSAIAAVKSGKIKFYPNRWTGVYLDWMENIRDWCISRQIWWGHRIPVYYCLGCNEMVVSKTKPKECPKCKSTQLKQDDDVLDTWFSSWLWPFSTFGWPEKTDDLKYFYPTSVLVTAQEIIFFWVARMIMAGLEFMNDVPFRDVYIHGTVRDATGTKMSKSLGNIIDPVDIIEEYGADALRFSLIFITATGQDVFLSKDKFELGRNFANKIWNASRFVLMNLDESLKCDFNFKKEDLSFADRWILSRLNHAVDSVTKALANYKFNEAANTIYEFFWHEFCDWYVELAKLKMTKDEFKGAARRKTVQSILICCLDNSLRLLHPFMPFVTEEIWQNLPHRAKSLMTTDWPKYDKTFIDREAEEEFNLLIGIITSIRNIRAEIGVPPQKLCRAIISTSNVKKSGTINKSLNYIEYLARTESVEICKTMKRPKASSVAVFSGCEICIPLEGLIDLDAEREKLKNRISDIEKRIKPIEVKLKNKDFVQKAPKEIVANEKIKLKELVNALNKLKENLKRSWS
ncbi:MAG: valine--tRNA ligase [Candidatus Omnitrophota bacterium]